MIGQVKWPAYSAMNKMYQANSVNPKPFRHGNTELNSDKSDKRVESINLTSHREDDVLRTLWKHKESHRNDVIAYQGGYVATDCVMLMMVDIIQPPYRVIGKVQMPNSVEAKALSHANTELNSEKSDKCVQTIEHLSLWDKDIVGTCRKLQELTRNELANIYKNIVTNLRCHRYDLISGRTWHCHLSLREHNRLVFD